MKLKTLMVSAVALLCSAASWAYTSVVPQVGRSYYLYNIGNGAYFKGTRTSYSATTNIADATPVTVEQSGSKYKLAFVDGGTTYRIYQSKGDGDPDNTSGVEFSFDGSATDSWGYQLKSNNGDWPSKDRYMTWNGTYLEFRKEDYNNIRDWYFISVYEVDATTASQCATTAEANYVTSADGWERVMNNTTLDASVNDYFFAIVCANNPGIMVKMANGASEQQAGGGYTTSKSMWYSTGTDPISDNNYLWIIEKNNTSGYEGYTFRNTNDPYLTIQAEWGASQYAHTHDQTDVCQWNSYELSQTSGVYTIKTLANGGTNYLGLWTPSNDYLNGQELAGNKSAAEQGKFLIYRKLVKNLNLTNYIKNPSFESNADDWTFTNGSSDWRSAFQRVSTGGVEEYNRNGVKCEQTITNLPNGIYTLTVQGYYRGGGGGYSGDARNAKLFANDEEVDIMSINDYKGITEQPSTGNWTKISNSYFVPDNTTAANYAINTLNQYNNEVTVAVSNGTLKIGVKKDAEVENDWTYFDSFTLTYIDGLHDLTPVSGNMNAAVNTAQQNAVTTYNDNKTATNYIAAMDAIADAEASVAAYAKAKTYLESVEEVLATTNFYTPTAYNSVYGTYKTAYDARTLEDATADGLTYEVAGSGGTERYTNNTANALLIPGWQIGSTTASDTNSGFYINTWSTEDNSKGFANPFYEYWVGSGSLAATTLTGTISGLTANANYIVTANVRVVGNDKVTNSIRMKVGSGTAVDVTQGNRIDETSHYVKSYTAVGKADGSGNLTLTFTVDASSNISWLAFRDINYRLGASDDQKTALATAITNAESKTLGFESGEYAPYNNISVLEALDAANALDADTATPEEVVAATSAIADSEWDANGSDVNAIYNGNFSSSEDWGLTGWTRTNNWGQQRADLPGDCGASTNYGYYNQPGSLKYGDTGHYTMPLKANTIYTLSFKYASWEDNSNEGITASVLNATDGMAAMNFAENNKKYDTSGAFVTQTIKFVTGAAGNYVLTLTNSGNTVITDVSITKDAEQTLTLSQTGSPTYAPGTYPSVTLPRTLSTTNWNTLCLPFETPASNYDGAKELTGVDVDGKNISITFSDVVGTLTAGKPYLVKGKGGTSISASSVEVLAEPDDAPYVTNDGATITYYGIFAPMAEIAKNAGNYIVSSSKLYLVDDDEISLKGYRGYFNVVEPTGVKQVVLNFDDADIIKALEATENENRVIYNLAGQRLNKAQKGVNIINGKKVLVK